MTDTSKPDQTPPLLPPSPPNPDVVDARALFGDKREVVIEHDGVRYRLRITRRNKLILQK